MDFNGLDYGTYSFFHFQAHDLPVNLDPLMRVGDSLGGYPATALVLGLAIVFAPRPAYLRMFVVVVTAYVVGGLMLEGVRLAVHRARPANAENILGVAGDPSFPSRAVFLAAFAWPILALALDKRLTSRAARIVVHALAALIVVFVCVSELWLSLHYLTDVLAGLSGGIGLSLLVRWAAAAPDVAPGLSRADVH